MAVDFENGGLVNLGADIYAQVGPEGEGNQGILVTGEGSVLVDGYVRNYTPLMESVNEITKPSPVRFVVNTHDDIDHFSMNHYFRREGATIFASEVCRGTIQAKMAEDSWIENLKSRNPGRAHEITDPEELVPHVGVRTRASLTPGGEKMELIFMGHGHSTGDLIIHLPERKLIFGGDLIFAGVHGQLKTCDVGGLLRILDQLAEIPCDTIVPGHGAPTVGTAAETIATYRDYVSDLHERIADMASSGLGVDKIKTKFGDWKYKDWGRPQLLPIAIEHVYKDFLWRTRFQV